MRNIIKLVKGTVIALLLLISVSVVCIGRVGAYGDALSVGIDFDDSGIYEYNGNYYLSSASKNGSAMKYVIKNDSSEAVKISAISISETLSGLSYNYGNTLYEQSYTIPAGGSIEILGKLFGFDDSDEFVFQYDVKVAYTKYDDFGMELPYEDSDLESIVSSAGDSIVYITKEDINIDASYDSYQSGDDILQGDTVTLSLVLESNANVPVRGIVVYDSVYGYLGEVEELLPGDTIEVTADIVVSKSTLSYAYITYQSNDHTQTQQQIDFSSAKVNIVVASRDYRLSLELRCENMYISKNQRVEITFVVTNLGSGDIDNITVLDPDGDEVFSIPYLSGGEIYETGMTLSFSPNTIYEFSCISPKTTKATTAIEFLSLPGVTLSYTFDKDVLQYKYLDVVTVTYKIENKGSVDAVNLILKDGGQTVTVGKVAKGKTVLVTLKFTLAMEETVISPELTGNFSDGDKTPIEEESIATSIYVEVPEKFAEIEAVYVVVPEVILNGQTATVSYTLKNIGSAPLTSYNVVIVEKNMVIASEGVLNPMASKTFTTDIVCNSSVTYTFKISGKHGDEGELYEKEFIVDIITSAPVVTLPPDGATLTPTVTPSPTPSASAGALATPGNGDDFSDNNEQLTYVLVFTVGVVSCVILLLTIAVLLYKILRKKQ
ncbi:MAG: hypothetical protein E7312_07195 [Clostridiales bacterium]|nr:hypothetical protein [Clostridiales bacterium]